MGRKTFTTNCIGSNGQSINDMVADARQITRRTFLKHVSKESLKDIELSIGYELHPRRGLTMAGDFSVTYHKSKYRGKPCVYFDWSSIEYIFI